MIVAEIVESNSSAAAAGAAPRVSHERHVAAKRNERASQPERASKRAKNARTDAPSMRSLPISLGQRPERGGRTGVSRVVPEQRRQSPSDPQVVATPRPNVRRFGRSESSSDNNRNSNTHRNDANAATAPHVPPAAATEPRAAAQASKSAAEIEQEVRELLDGKLFGKDDAAKVDALRKLNVYLQKEESSEEEHQQMKEYSRAVSNLGGCHLVLVALRLEIDKDGGPNRNVVLRAVQFLQYWNLLPDRHVAMSRFNGVGKIVRAMEAFPNDEEIQLAAIACVFNYTHDGTAARRHELLEENCLRRIVRAASPSTDCGRTKVLAMRVLERLCDIDGHSHVDRLVDRGALVAVARTYSDHTTFGAPQCQICTVSRRLMNKLHG